MKKFLLPLCVFLLTAAYAISAAGQTPRVNRTILTSVERDLDARIFRIWNDNPLAVVGPARGVYLPGYGIVFSVEMNLVTPPGGGLMGQPLTDADKVALHKQKVQRVPQLKAAMKDILPAIAEPLSSLPANEQVVIALTLPRFVWEESAGVPIQLTIQATRQQLSDAKTDKGALAAIKITELN